MSWVRIWVHLVFATKGRDPLLTNSIRKPVFQHIRDNAKQKSIWLDCINGHTDHAHCLISLDKDRSVRDTVQLIKGESSYWINKQKLVHGHFAWQDDYWAVGVSESHVDSVRSYISAQEEHHRKVPFAEEVELFMSKFGWKLIHEEN